MAHLRWLAKKIRKPCREALQAMWGRFAAERDLAKEKRRTVGVRNPEPPTALEIAWRAIAQLEERASVFPRREALALALAHSPGQYDLATIEGAFAQLERDGHLLPAIRRGVGEAWTTARAVNAEREVIERMRAGIGAGAPLQSTPITAQALEGLTDGQRAAARLILETPDRTVGVQGYAGTGKTVMLRRVAACWPATAASSVSRPRRRRTATDVARGLEEYGLDAARDVARRRTAETLHASDRIRRGLDRHARDGLSIEASAERCGALADAAQALAPNLPHAEASRLAEAVRDAGHHLRRRLIEARRRLQLARDWFQRSWPNHYHDRLRADWDAHRASDAFHPEDIERHRPWMDRFRDLSKDSHLDPGNREALDRLLHAYDTAWPSERRRCVETVRRWDDLVHRAPDGLAARVPEYDDVLRELRAVVKLDTLTERERESIRAILRAHDEHRERSR